ncbi:MAG: hypothetical protein JNK95_09770 [Candidatus Competibacter sp.]|nr:hypothetical protein [Candidatus Competibacter sp.]MDG4607008.1 hypothetical protein [Candidatus Contendobacter sp.]HRD50766.1 hypothetical protein [Candidatus Contendobacter sp.]
MNAFGRILNTAGLAQGGLLQLEAAPPLTYPSISPNSMRNAQEMFMFQQGLINNPPARPIYTLHASGGCVPICAAEITPPRTVNWIYLMHAHGGNDPLNVAAAAANPANVYVCMLVYSGASSLWAAQNCQGTFFTALDPANAIPNANALLIYGAHTTLVISRQAMIAVDIV